MDKTIEVMKTAMEKEKGMKNQSKETMDEPIDDKKQIKTSEKVSDHPAAEMNEDEIEPDAESNTEEEETGLNDEEESDDKEADKTEGRKAKTGKSFFKRNKELEAKDQKIAELTDRLMRSMAEFDNFRKRSEKEKSQMYDIGVKSIIEKLLPIIDNFERGLGTISEKEKESAFAQGIELIYKQLVTALDEIGVKPIDAVGKEFNPDYHNAVMHGEDENLGENIVSDEFQKGYMYHDMVVRHSMVKVVN